MRRRDLVLGATSALVGALAPTRGRTLLAETVPPTSSRGAFIAWATQHRRENPQVLGARWDRYVILRQNGDLARLREQRAFLLTPRDRFVLKDDIDRAYHHEFNLIGFGVAMSAAWLVCRMTAALDVQSGDKVLEVGTGSGYHAAFLANLANQVWSIEIIEPLARRTRGILSELIAEGFTELKAIKTKHDDGYYGWAEGAPFDKIVVTCGIDHIPPALLQQLRPNGIMVIPIGPLGAHRLLKVVKQQSADGTVRIARSNISSNYVIPFTPLNKLAGDAIDGTHSGRR